MNHSANVTLTLVVAGTEYPLSQVGPGFLITKETTLLLAGRGELVITIDGREKRKPIEFQPIRLGFKHFKTREVLS